MRVCSEERSETQVHIGSRERRDQGSEELMRAGSRRRANLFVGDTEKARTRAHLQPWALHPNNQMMEASAPLCIKRRVVWPVADQVITLLILKSLYDAAGEIVSDVNEVASRLLAKVVQPILRGKELTMTIGQA